MTKCNKCSDELFWDSQTRKWEHETCLVCAVGPVCFVIKHDGKEFVELCGCKNPVPELKK